MRYEISTKDPAAVAREAQAAYLAMFPQGDPSFVPRVFHWAGDCFNGRYDGYQPVDARYHDFEHTLQGTLCMARLLLGRRRAGAQPALSQRMAELGLLAILMHDTGYLKRKSDTGGTGAKYTLTHVSRSAEFAGHLMSENGFSDKEIAAVQNMICCTGVDTMLQTIPFQGEEEKITGMALGTADLLGQMAADDYVEKLPVLYGEFAEAARFTGQKDSFVSAFDGARDLLQKTPDFWENFVKPKLEREFGGQSRFLNDPYPDGPNAYVEKIEANIQRLREVNASEENTTAFLKKYREP